MKGEEKVSRQMSMMWTVAAWNGLMMKDGFSPGQLVFERNQYLLNLIGENNPSSLERGEEEDYLRGTLNAIHQARVAHIQMESEDRVRRALKHKIRSHPMELAEIGDEVYYKKDNEDNWRGPGRVLGRDGKVVLVKQGGSLKEVTRVHITRLRGLRGTEDDVGEDEGDGFGEQEGLEPLVETGVGEEMVVIRRRREVEELAGQAE